MSLPEVFETKLRLVLGLHVILLVYHLFLDVRVGLRTVESCFTEWRRKLG